MRNPVGPVQRFVVSVWKRNIVKLSHPEPIISFTFDDFPQSALLAGGSILQSYGARGTYYVSMGLMDKINEEGKLFAWRDLHNLLAAGHELASHTYSHCSCRTARFETFWTDALRGEREVCEYAGRSKRGNFAYPGGDVSLMVKARLGSMMRSCRGIRGGVMGPFADLNLLRANRLYSRFFDMTAVERLISENRKRRGWLIFYTHDISERPSPYGCMPSQFESAVRMAFHSRARILTISDALDVIEGAAGQASSASPCNAGV